MTNNNTQDPGLNSSFKKARFFKCALQVNPAGYIQYRGQQQILTEAQYNQQLLTAALEAGIEVIGLAAHGSVDGVDAIRDLGVCFHEGDGVRADEKAAVRCYRLAAREGDHKSMYNLGLCYLDGDGVKPNTAKSLEWFQKAAAAGNRKAKAKIKLLAKF